MLHGIYHPMSQTPLNSSLFCQFYAYRNRITQILGMAKTTGYETSLNQQEAAAEQAASMPSYTTFQDALSSTWSVVTPRIITDQCHPKDNPLLDQGPLSVCVNLHVVVTALQTPGLCSPASVTGRKLSLKYIQNVLSCSYFVWCNRSNPVLSQSLLNRVNQFPLLPSCFVAFCFTAGWFLLLEHAACPQDGALQFPGESSGSTAWAAPLLLEHYLLQA